MSLARRIAVRAQRDSRDEEQYGYDYADAFLHLSVPCPSLRQTGNLTRRLLAPEIRPVRKSRAGVQPFNQAMQNQHSSSRMIPDYVG
jgi:hypothetical protein